MNFNLEVECKECKSNDVEFIEVNQTDDVPVFSCNGCDNQGKLNNSFVYLIEND